MPVYVWQVLNLALHSEPLRDELFCQLVKQFTGNGRQYSVERLWQLMLLALTTFPPSVLLENYLEMFLRCGHPVAAVCWCVILSMPVCVSLCIILQGESPNTLCCGIAPIGVYRGPRHCPLCRGGGRVVGLRPCSPFPGPSPSLPPTGLAGSGPAQTGRPHAHIPHSRSLLRQAARAQAHRWRWGLIGHAPQVDVGRVVSLVFVCAREQ